MAVRLRHDALARLLEHERSTDRVVLEDQAGRAAPLGGVMSRAIDRDLTEDGRVDQLVDEPHLLGLPRADVPAGEDHVERALKPDQSRQPLRAPRTRDQPELDLG